MVVLGDANTPHGTNFSYHKFMHQKGTGFDTEKSLS